LLSLLDRGEVRLLTLTGAGGTGKTRLAIKTAAEAADRYPDGVFWAGLAPLRDAALVLPTIAHSLGAGDDLAGYLRDRRVLVLVDNLEHLLESGPDLAVLLAACPGLQLLVTSREPLRLAGEREYPVAPLPVEEAVVLFEERAAAVRPDFMASDEVAAICRRLDNLPLALELAAARVRALTAGQILERLERRLPFLTGGPRDVVERQRTLRDTIAWSYDLLAPIEQLLFVRLAVFAGGCTLEGAEIVCDAELDVLQALVEKSLIRRDGERYWMLETIREYALDQLDGVAELELRGRHAAFFLPFAEDAVGVVDRGSDRLSFAERFSDELENLRTVLTWFEQQRRDEELARLAVALYQYWIIRGPMSEARLRLGRALECSVAAEPALRRKVLSPLAYIEFLQRDITLARSHAEEALQIAAQLDDDSKLAAINIAAAIKIAVQMRTASGAAEDVHELYREGIALARATDNHYRLATLLLNLAEWQLVEGEISAASTTAAETLSLFEQLENDWFAAGALRTLAVCALLANDQASCRERLERALTIATRFRDPIGLRACIYILSALEAVATRFEHSARLLGTAEALEYESGALTEAAETVIRRQAEHLIVEAPSGPIEAARNEVRKATFDTAAALALETLERNRVSTAAGTTRATRLRSSGLE
jgi:predicted ATPase